RGDLRIGAAEARIAATLAGFQRWAARHAGDGCPEAATLAKLVDGGVDDPWGRPLAITCTDQPADQIIGVVSAGPDGVAGTRDDVESWTLGADVIDPIPGPRGSASPGGSPRRGGPGPHPPPPRAPPRPPAGPHEPH